MLLGDDVVHAETPCLKQTIEIYDRYGSSILGIQEVEREDVHKCGIVDGEQMEESPAGSGGWW